MYPDPTSRQHAQFTSVRPFLAPYIQIHGTLYLLTTWFEFGIWISDFGFG